MLPDQTNNQNIAPTRESWWFPRIWAGFVLSLIAATFPLWFLVGQADVPLVPLINLGISNADLLARASTVALVSGLIGILVAPERLRPLWWLVAGSLLVSFLLDQHRLQPWAYQTAIYAAVFATLPPRRARSWLIPLAASIYIYSSAGKFDFQFVHTVGQEFLDTLTRSVGGLPDDWNLSLRAPIVLLFPAIEFSLGIGLLFRPTRKIAAVLVMLMHVVLLLILGPWGLGHSTGVLVWNIALISQAYLLMIRQAPSESDQSRRWAPIAYGLVTVALLAPLIERSGYWDHWTSWALYSPHHSRIEIEIHQSAVGELPEPLRSYVQRDTDGDRWRGFSLQRWSLTARMVPIYPQARYQLLLSNQIAQRYQLGDAIRVRQGSVSNRWTGERVEQWWLGQREIQQSLGQFWL